MCTVVINRRPGHPWPVLLGANRDEMKGRAWRPPARHWADRPEIMAGLDEQAGGTWMGVNDHGLVAGVLNRPMSLGPAPGKRSRGELVLEALDHADAADAAAALAEIDPAAYRPFNLFVIDNQDAFWLRNEGEEGPGRVEAFELPVGVSMLTSRNLSDQRSPRVRLYLDRFRDAPAPDPETGDWASWEGLLTSRETLPGEGPDGAMAIVTDMGFETTSSSLIALPAPGRDLAPVWRFATGTPSPGAYRPIALERLKATG